MTLTKTSRRALSMSAFLSLAGLPLALPATAQDAVPPEDDSANDVIIVTGAIRQGGAQDAQHFRSISLDTLETKLPLGESLTMEGLMGEHDLALPASGQCDQLFCITAHAKASSLQPGAQFLGIGFESAVDVDAYTAAPLSLIAVVDRSGSMSGDPIDRVKEGLHAVVKQLRDGDRMGIVIYGSETLVHQQVIDVLGNRDTLRQAIDDISIYGSTYMEAGLKLGFEAAFAEAEATGRKTRLMLFSDENPNVGDTSADGFMGQAINGSRNGVDMTTIGVGTHFRGDLATKISSVRGGNLFFLPEEGSGASLFKREFASMVSAVAYDIAIAIDPAPGVKVGAVYGVPNEIIEDAGDGTITVNIASAFLASNAGGIFAQLEGAGAAPGAKLADITVAYTDAASEARESDAQSVAVSEGAAPANLAKAEMLVDQFVTTKAALAAFHEDDDPAQSAALLAGLSERFAASEAKGLREEVKLVDSLQMSAARLAGLATDGLTQPFEILGDWQVVAHKGVTDLSRGDRIEITDDGEFITERTRGRDKGDDIYQDFELNERQMRILGTQLVFRYKVKGDRLTLRNAIDGTEIRMVRADT